MKTTKKQSTVKLSDLKIESGIQVETRKSISEAYELLDRMQVGQSIKVPTVLRRQIISAKCSIVRNTNKVFITRTVDKYNIRLWRIEDGTKLKTNKQK